MVANNLSQGGRSRKEKMGQQKKSDLEKVNLLLYHVESRRILLEKIMNPELSLEETALLLNISKSTIRNYTKSGILKCTRTPGGQRRFHLVEIVRYVATQNGDLLDIFLQTENLIRQAQARIANKRKLAPPKETGPSAPLSPATEAQEARNGGHEGARTAGASNKQQKQSRKSGDKLF
ncbi:MAG: helix-turn-helix domain-containing protein [bacterium]